MWTRAGFLTLTRTTHELGLPGGTGIVVVFGVRAAPLFPSRT
jgi:hypothetical protein